MKKIIFIFLPLMGFAQDISPYYPVKQDNAFRGLEPSQLTYYDARYVQGLLPEFLKTNLGMTQVSSNMDGKTGTIEQVYQDSFSDGKLVFNLTKDVITADVTDPEIIKSIKITGTPERVISFFVRYWDTTMDFTNIKTDVERKHMQDVARLNFNKGKPYIIVENNTYKNSADFSQHFNILLQSK